MQAKRPLLWLSPEPSQTVSDLPRMLDWEIYPFDLANSPHAALPVLPEVRVGLLDLRQFDSERYVHVEKWTESLAPTVWAGLLSEPPREDPHLNNVIASHCADYHTWPCDTARLNTVLGHFWGMADLQAQINASAEKTLRQHTLAGSSSAIKATRNLLHKFAGTLEPVLIFGESGTGKTAAAQFIHHHSPVRRGPLVTINCATLPASLTQSELFGYEKGAFTHAFAARAGRIEAAHGGTLLLIGIDELAPDQQSVLLRFLQEGQVERLGSQRVRTVNARIITTSSAALQTLVQAGRFRADVFYRLGGLEVRLPALRERLEDVPMLAECITKAIPSSGLKPTKKLSKAALRCLCMQPWPGNLRELQNCLRQALLLSNGLVLSPEDLGINLGPPPDASRTQFTLADYRTRAEQEAVAHCLAFTNQNVSAAARMLNISRVSLYRMMKKHQEEQVYSLDPTDIAFSAQQGEFS